MNRNGVFGLAVTCFGLAMLAGTVPAAAQQPENPGPSFEAALKRLCPTRNLEFLPTDTLARTTDAYVAGLPRDTRDKARRLSEPGVKACQGNADDGCRTAAVLGTLRYLGLSEPLAQRFCGLAVSCTDWFQCAPDAAPGLPRQAQVAPVTPSPATSSPAERTDGEDSSGARQAPPPRATTPPPARVPVSDRLTPPPSTATEAVEGFYGALGRRDGIAAASFLIPEKRGRGNYSAAAMQRFYGGLARPLALRSVAPVGPMTVLARYDFATRAGAVCDGRAIVSLRSGSQGVLIQSIRALSNC